MTTTVTPTHVAAISLDADRVEGNVCELSIGVAEQIEHRHGGFGYAARGGPEYVMMTGQIVLHSVLYDAPLAAADKRDLAAAAADEVLARYGWTRLGDWDDADDTLWADLAAGDDTVTDEPRPVTGAIEAAILAWAFNEPDSQVTTTICPVAFGGRVVMIAAPAPRRVTPSDGERVTVPAGGYLVRQDDDQLKVTVQTLTAARRVFTALPETPKQ